MTNDEEKRLKAEVASIAARVLDGTVGITEGARRIVTLGQRLGIDKDADFTTFVGIDSETDQFPLGPARSHWAADSLTRYDAERQKIEDFYQRYAEQACRSLIQKYEQNG